MTALAEQIKPEFQLFLFGGSLLLTYSGLQQTQTLQAAGRIEYFAEQQYPKLIAYNTSYASGDVYMMHWRVWGYYTVTEARDAISRILSRLKLLIL